MTPAYKKRKRELALMAIEHRLIKSARVGPEQWKVFTAAMGRSGNVIESHGIRFRLDTSLGPYEVKLTMRDEEEPS